MSIFGYFPPDPEHLSKPVTSADVSNLVTSTEAASCSRCAFSSVCIYASDLEATCAFYTKVLGLTEIQGETLRNDTRLLAFSNGCKLQIIGSVSVGPQGGSSHHFAIASPDFDATVKFLIVNGISWGARDGEPRKVTVRPDGVRQIFLNDPDHNLIEINDEPQGNSVPFSPPWFVPEGSYQT